MDDRLSRFELKTLIDSTKLILESQDLDFIMNNLLFMIMGKLLITRALILLRNPVDDTYSVAKTKGRSHFAQNQKFRLPIAVPNPTDPPIRLWENDHEMFPGMLANEGYRVMVNLRTNSDHLGWLCLSGKPTGIPFTPRELNFLESVVVIPSVGISNTQLIGELKIANRSLDQKVQELHTLFDLSKEFSQSVDRDQILRIFKFALMGQMGVRSFFLILERGGQLEPIVQNALKVKPTDAQLREIFDLSGDTVTFCNPDDALEVLASNQIQILINLRLQDQKVAVLAIGKRLGKADFTEADTNFLVSLGNLVLMSVQKTYLMEARIEKERLEKELRLARNIQQTLLPSSIPDIRCIDLTSRNVPSQQVGGDYYDIVDLGHGKFLMAIADVTGKGVPASLIMANVQAMVHMLAPFDLPLAEKTARINDAIYKKTPSDTFVTFFWGVYDSKERSLHYVNAGHNPPMLFRKGENEPTELQKGGIILGALPTMMPYESDTVFFEDCDILVLFTDGISEAMSPTDEEYGEQRLIEVVNGFLDDDARTIGDRIIASIDDFTDSKYSDDVTLMVLKVIPDQTES